MRSVQRLARVVRRYKRLPVKVYLIGIAEGEARDLRLQAATVGHGTDLRVDVVRHDRRVVILIGKRVRAGQRLPDIRHRGVELGAAGEQGVVEVLLVRRLLVHVVRRAVDSGVTDQHVGVEQLCLVLVSATRSPSLEP